MCSQLKLKNDIFDLPDIRGKYRFNSDLSKVNWFQIGGKADVVFWPKDEADLQYFLQNISADIPVTIIGVGSNLLVRDGGIRGIVIRLGREFAKISLDNNIINTGTGTLSASVANFALENSLTNCEFLVGIPGSIGGALAMNAGAYGQEIKDIFVKFDAIDRQGRKQTLFADDFEFSYRSNNIDKDWIFTRAYLRGEIAEYEVIKNAMDKIKTDRENSQPIKTKTSGSTFRNPSCGQKGNIKKAWELIDEAGCRGLTIGDAMVSEKHCNFLINKGNATATDMENLGEEIRRRVKLNSGIDLLWEIKRIGEIK